nr:transposase [Streptomyces sp. CT34]
MLPADFPAWDRVYAFFRRWRTKGLAQVRDFETLPASSEAFIYFSQAMLLSRRLARSASRTRSEQHRWAVAA